MERAVAAAFSWLGRWQHYQLLKDRHGRLKAKEGTAGDCGNSEGVRAGKV